MAQDFKGAISSQNFGITESAHYGSNICTNLLNYDDTLIWDSSSLSPKWIEIQFSSPQIITAYLLRSSFYDDRFVRNWTVTGYYKTRSFEVDNKINDESITSANQSAVFPLPRRYKIERVNFTFTNTTFWKDVIYLSHIDFQIIPSLIECTYFNYKLIFFQLYTAQFIHV